MESNKQPLKLIRGSQEFCDVALDVIYYIKEFGLLRPEPKARKERSDKGVPRGFKKSNEETTKDKGKGKASDAKGKGKKKSEVDESEKANKGGKRGRETKVSVLQPRKKQKLEEKKSTKAKKNPSTVTVVKTR
ncbi:hypothetical protein P153DRAFT_370170 [Dothidotthia symphoricarpi CBS 119687]|uniref:Uncharacterized protein n=1 Tax=Dothidotthia symphoricarpi CBS 119687 TaxID=1392245 RepID=A0A6A6A112_9PLEO|nr:uncharacterized protein P153DRAFT_370170 [Dothidotthia symphoricarpi CBS 119687]KAF2125510.1 hypothetical protein P153DRAFT_370170 [Dothidotthia symphoricarpi CBS 119687]